MWISYQFCTHFDKKRDCSDNDEIGHNFSLDPFLHTSDETYQN